MSGYSRRCRRVVNEYLESAWPRVHRAFYRCTRSRSTPEERLGCVSTGITPRPPRGGSRRVKSGHGRNSIDSRLRFRSSPFWIVWTIFSFPFFPYIRNETFFSTIDHRDQGLRIRSNICRGPRRIRFPVRWFAGRNACARAWIIPF